MADTQSIRIADADHLRLRRLQLAALERSGATVSIKDLVSRGIDLLEQQAQTEASNIALWPESGPLPI